MNLDFNTLKKICDNPHVVAYIKDDIWNYDIPASTITLEKKNNIWIDIYEDFIKPNLNQIDYNNFVQPLMRRAFGVDLSAVYFDYLNIQGQPYLLHHCLSVGDLIDYRFYKRVGKELHQFKMAFIVEKNDDDNMVITTFDTNQDFIKACKKNVIKINRQSADREYNKALKMMNKLL